MPRLNVITGVQDGHAIGKVFEHQGIPLIGAIVVAVQ